MVDCGNSRCSQERRNFKKELYTWSKKVPLVIGLETIAEQYGGKKRIQKVLEPFRDPKSSVGSVDWQPNTTCHFCTSRNNFIYDLIEKGTLGENGSDTAGLKYLQQLAPLAFSQQGLPSTNTQSGTGAPLDLSAASPAKLKQPSKSEESKPPVQLKVPKIKKNHDKKNEGGRKNYTTNELAAAVQDVRSGKFGTRRASALYGVPRSTLRNKLFRSEPEPIHNGYHDNPYMLELLKHAPFSDPWSSFFMEGEKELQIDWGNKLDQIRRKHNITDENRPFGLPPSMHYYGYYTLFEYEKLYGLGNPFVHELRFSYLPELAKKMAEERFEYEKSRGKEKENEQDTFSVDATSHTSKNTKENKLTFVKQELQEFTGNEPESNVSKPTLKIPSYKPASPSSSDITTSSTEEMIEYSKSKVGDTLKDIIAKTITEKLKSRAQICEPSQELAPLYGSQSVFPGMPFTDDKPPTPVAMPVPQETQIASVPSGPPAKKQKIGTKENKSSHGRQTRKIDSTPCFSSDEEKPMKKTRPKRGQYRKYNAQLLLEAVKAVQRGEMSVHRAGSYFGVPHSTLEYKVKERHLLRQKKVKENKEPKKSTQPKSKKNEEKMQVEKSSASSGPAQSIDASVINSSHFLPGLSTLPWMPLGAGFPVSIPGVGLPGYNFSQDTSASELLKRLQQKVQAKADSVQANASSTTV